MALNPKAEERNVFFKKLRQLNFLYCRFSNILPLHDSERIMLDKLYTRSLYAKRLFTTNKLTELLVLPVAEEEKDIKEDSFFYFHRDFLLLSKRSAYRAIESLKDYHVIIDYGLAKWNRDNKTRHKFAINIIGFLTFVEDWLRKAYPSIKAETIKPLLDLRTYFTFQLAKMDMSIAGNQSVFVFPEDRPLTISLEETIKETPKKIKKPMKKSNVIKLRPKVKSNAAN